MYAYPHLHSEYISVTTVINLIEQESLSKSNNICLLHWRNVLPAWYHTFKLGFIQHRQKRTLQSTQSFNLDMFKWTVQTLSETLIRLFFVACVRTQWHLDLVLLSYFEEHTRAAALFCAWGGWPHAQNCPGSHSPGPQMISTTCSVHDEQCKIVRGRKRAEESHKPRSAEDGWSQSLLQGYWAFASLRVNFLAPGVFFGVVCVIQDGRRRCYTLPSVSHLLHLFPDPCLPNAVSSFTASPVQWHISWW